MRKRHTAMHPDIKSRARELRRNPTIPEQRLWSILRDRRLAGLKFRRQYPINPFFVDFLCFEKKLVVELDGMSHVGRAVQDEQRTHRLESNGWSVFRVTNDDVLQSIEAVADGIARAAGAQ